jgi:hypothetical protein
LFASYSRGIGTYKLNTAAVRAAAAAAPGIKCIQFDCYKIAGSLDGELGNGWLRCEKTIDIGPNMQQYYTHARERGGPLWPRPDKMIFSRRVGEREREV